MAQRNTVQQQVVADALVALASHPTADEVYQAIHEEHPSISRATVYRVLNKLAGNGSVLKVPMQGSADRFDHQTHGHYHVRCEGCGRVDDLDMPVFTGLDEKADASSEYVIRSHAIQFNGLCEECQAKAC